MCNKPGIDPSTLLKSPNHILGAETIAHRPQLLNPVLTPPQRLHRLLDKRVNPFRGMPRRAIQPLRPVESGGFV